jgi:hypothetical protein
MLFRKRYAHTLHSEGSELQETTAFGAQQLAVGADVDGTPLVPGEF